MKKYLLFITLFALVISCSNSNASSKDNVAEYLQPSLTNNSFYEQWKSVKVDKNLQHFKRYQTFNEFTMKGEGIPNKTPYVYVKKIKDTITVRSSYELDSARIYIQIAKNLWYSHMYYSKMARDGRILVAGHHNIAGDYDRFFYNDSIVEFRTEYRDFPRKKSAIVKTGSKLVLIDNYDYPLTMADSREYIYKLSKEINNKNVHVFTLNTTKDKYLYIADDSTYDYTIKYERKAYGLWGIQPGVWETYLYNGEEDVRTYIPEYEMEPKPDKDGVYDVVETMPKFPGGYKAVMDYIKEKVEKSDWDRESCAQGRVVVNCVVEDDGSISNVKVFRSVEPSCDKVAIQIVKEMPKWIPGKHHGKEVRVRYFIPVSFGL